MVRASLWATALPGAYWYVPAPAPLTFLFYYSLLGALLSGWLLKSRRWVWAAAASVVFLGSHAATAWAGRHDVRLTVLPLRGGDSLYFNAPGSTEDLLIDAGEESGARLMVTPFLHGQGVNRLPALLLTHGDVRHVGGASHLAAEFHVAQILTSAVRFRSPAYRLVVDNVLGPSARQRVLGRGDTWGRWTVLYPQADDRLSQADDQAVVLRGQFHRTRILLCSDLGRAGQRRLLDREGDLRADIVVAGIPAGSEPLGEALLDAVEPQVIILSAGNYPAREQASRILRARLEQRGVPVFYTSDDGAVQLTVRPDGWEIRATRSGRMTTDGR
jgi:competence protein ComEC